MSGHSCTVSSSVPCWALGTRAAHGISGKASYAIAGEATLWNSCGSAACDRTHWQIDQHFGTPNRGPLLPFSPQCECKEPILKGHSPGGAGLVRGSLLPFLSSYAVLAPPSSLGVCIHGLPTYWMSMGLPGHCRALFLMGRELSDTGFGKHHPPG